MLHTSIHFSSAHVPSITVCHYNELRAFAEMYLVQDVGLGAVRILETGEIITACLFDKRWTVLALLHSFVFRGNELSTLEKLQTYLHWYREIVFCITKLGRFTCYSEKTDIFTPPCLTLFVVFISIHSMYSNICLKKPESTNLQDFGIRSPKCTRIFTCATIHLCKKKLKLKSVYIFWVMSLPGSQM